MRYMNICDSRGPGVFETRAFVQVVIGNYPRFCHWYNYVLERIQFKVERERDHRLPSGHYGVTASCIEVK